jgi:hypothetical protein
MRALNNGGLASATVLAAVLAFLPRRSLSQLPQAAFVGNTMYFDKA